MTMRERVAELQYEDLRTNAILHDARPWTQLSTIEQKPWLLSADAAISAVLDCLGEVTEEMVEAGVIAMFKAGTESTAENEVAAIFTAMLKAART